LRSIRARLNYDGQPIILIKITELLNRNIVSSVYPINIVTANSFWILYKI